MKIFGLTIFAVVTVCGTSFLTDKTSYSNFEIENNWQSHFLMTEIFANISNEISTKLNFQQDKVEQENTINYLRKLYDEKKNYP